MSVPAHGLPFFHARIVAWSILSLALALMPLGSAVQAWQLHPGQDIGMTAPPLILTIDSAKRLGVTPTSGINTVPILKHRLLLQESYQSPNEQPTVHKTSKNHTRHLLIHCGRLQLEGG